MPRDMTGTGRYPPQPKHKPIAFYSAVRLGDPEQLASVMAVDPYFVTQDNGAGAPLHFATTYKQLDMVHHLLESGAEINQRDDKGFTPLHRAAYLAHYEGYLEIYEFLLSRGADPSIRTEDYDPYLDPGRKLPFELAIEEDNTRLRLKQLEQKYAAVSKVRQPHPDIGCWWTLYDYGLEAVKGWALDHKHVYPEDVRRTAEIAERKARKAKRRGQQTASGKATKAATAAAALPAAPRPIPSGPVAFLFPGQGSQAIGMLKDARSYPAVVRMLDAAKAVLGYDLGEVCAGGPKERLDDTAVAQPALYVAGLAAIERLRAEDPAAVAACTACAGLSLGEYCALAFAGVISFEDGLKAVKVRGEAMSAAARAGRPHGMLSIIGLEDAPLEDICARVRAKLGGDTVCQLANFLFPTGRVVSGHKDALNEVQAWTHAVYEKALAEMISIEQVMATAAGALKCAPLAVSGAFHTRLMEPAKDKLVKVLSEITFHEPRIPVLSNVTAEPFPDASAIPAMLARQLVEPVRWQDILAALKRAGKSRLHECGPGSQLKAMVKRIDGELWKAMRNVSV